MAGHRGPDGREDGVSFLKSEGSYLWMTKQINVYLVPFYLFFFSASRHRRLESVQAAGAAFIIYHGKGKTPGL